MLCVFLEIESWNLKYDHRKTNMPIELVSGTGVESLVLSLL